MYDPKFERTVRQRMEELEFRPAESVWANIEHAIVAPRRGRRAVFFWRFLLPGLLVAAGAAIYVYHTSAVHGVKVADPATAKVAAPKPALNAPVKVERNVLPHAEGNAVPKIEGGMFPRIAANALPKVERDAMPRASGSALRKAERETLPTSGGNAGSEAEGTTATTVNAGSAAQSTVPAPWLFTPGMADQRFPPTIWAAAPKTQKTVISLTSLSPVRHPWEAGFVAGGGISRLNRLNVSHASQALAPQALSFYAISVSAAGKNYISDIRPDASFDGGIYLQKALSNRWVFKTGLNLHYYSTRINVGQQVNVYVTQSSSSYWNYPGSSPTSSVPLYSAGDQHVYTNKYYFLELPAAIQWKMNRSRMLPVYLEGGVSLARLMGANALYYNAQTGIYSKDGNIVNKTQLNIGSALLVGLPFHGVRIQMGPEVQYGVTPLVNNQSLGDQHLFYTGLRVVVLPVRR